MFARKSPSLVYPNPSKLIIDDLQLSGQETRDSSQGQETGDGLR